MEAKVIEVVRKSLPMEKVVVEYWSHYRSRYQQVVVSEDRKNGVDLKIQEGDGKMHAESWFLTKEAAEAIYLAIGEYFGLGKSSG